MQLTNRRTTIFSSSKGGGEIGFAVTGDTVFSPSREIFTEGRCAVLLTVGTQKTAAAVGDIEETHPSVIADPVTDDTLIRGRFGPRHGPGASDQLQVTRSGEQETITIPSS